MAGNSKSNRKLHMPQPVNWTINFSSRIYYVVRPLNAHFNQMTNKMNDVNEPKPKGQMNETENDDENKLQTSKRIECVAWSANEKEKY